MATQQYKAEVDLALKAPDAKNLEKTLDSILKTVESLPTEAKNASREFKDIVEQINKMRAALRQSGSFNNVTKEVKGLAATLKNLQVIAKTIELFSNKDLQNITQAEAKIRQLTKAFEATQRNNQIKQGVFGLDSKNIKETTAALKVLQDQLKATQQALSLKGGPLKANDPVFQESLQISKNIKALEQRRAELQRIAQQEKEIADKKKADDLARRKAEEEALRNQRAEKRRQEAEDRRAALERKKAQEAEAERQRKIATDGRARAREIKDDFATTPVGYTSYVNQAGLSNSRQSRLADPNFVALKAAQDELSVLRQQNAVLMQKAGLTAADLRKSAEGRRLNQEIRQLSAEIAKEYAKGNKETERSIELTNQLLKLRAQLKIEESQRVRKEPKTKEAEEQNRINAMISRTQGSGGAALLKVQMALMANWALLGNSVGAIQATISNSIELEAALKNVQAVTVTTGTDMVWLSEKIKDVAATSKFTAVEVADTALILGQAGLSAKQISDALPSVITLATAAGTSLANAVDIVTSIVGVFDKQASDTADVADKVTSASNNSKLSVEKLALALQYVGNAASQTGASFEETTAALATMSNAGIKSGSTLGTGLRQFLTEVQKPSEELLDSLRRVGLTISDIDVRSNGLVGVVENLRKAGFVASDAIKSFDVRSAAAFNALIANPEMFRQQYEGLQGNRAALEANEIQMQSLQAQSRRLGTSLNNLIDSGFEPIRKTLTLVSSAMSDVLAVMANYPGVMAAVTSATVFYIGVNIISHLSGIAAGWLLNANSASRLGLALRSLTGAAVASTAASTAASGAAVAGAGAFTLFTRSVVASTAGLGVFGGAMALAKAAALGLFAAIKGISLLTGLGLILGAVGLGLYFFTSKSDEAKKSIDKLKAASDEAKSSFDEKKASVDSLSKKIDELYYRQTNLEGNTRALNTVAVELNSQFGKLGFHVDKNNTSFGEMISKLQGVKSEMESIMGLKLGEQIQANQDLLQTQSGQLASAVGELRNGPRRGGGTSVDLLDAFIRKEGVLKSNSLNPFQKDQVSSGIATFRESLKADFLKRPDAVAALLEAANALNIVRTVLANQEKKEEFDKLTPGLNKAIAAAIAVSQTRQILDAEKGTQTRNNNIKGFKTQRIFEGQQTFEQALPRPYSVEAQVKKAYPGFKEDQIYYEVQRRTEEELEKVEQIKNVIRTAITSGLIFEDDAKILIDQANARGEEFRSAHEKYWVNIESRVKQETALEIQILKAKQKQARNNGDKAGQQEIERKIAALQSQLNMAGVVGANDRQRRLADINSRLGEEKANAIPDPRGSGQRASQSEKAAAEALIREAEVLERKAKGNRLSAENATTIEEANKELEKSVNNLIEAKVKRVYAEFHSQEAQIPEKERTPLDSERMARELQAVGEKADEEVKNRYESYSAIYKAVIGRDYKFGGNSDFQAQRLEDLQIQAQEEIDELTRPKRVTRSDYSLGSSFDPDAVDFEYDTPGTTAAREKETEVTRTRLKNLVAQYTLLLQNTSYLVESSTNVTSKIASIRSQLDTADTEEETRRLTAELEVYVGQQTDLTKKLQGTRKTDIGIQKDIATTSTTLGQQTKPLSRSQGLSEMSNNLYDQYKGDFEGMGIEANDLLSVIQSVNMGFSSLFTDLATGAKSGKDAFKDFSLGIIKSMLDIVTQMLAMQVITIAMRAMGVPIPAMANGGPIGISRASQLGSPVFAASGGSLSGGIAGRDSIPVMAMPGEYMVKKTAVDAVGVDFMNSLNNTTANSISASAPSTSSGKKDPEVTNIWVVTPDQKPPMGPKDIELILEDKLSQGKSSLKTLVRSIAMGQA